MNKSQIYKIEHDLMSLYDVGECENDDDYKIVCATMSAFNEMANTIIREIERDEKEQGHELHSKG